jgi:hypothetical protein
VLLENLAYKYVGNSRNRFREFVVCEKKKEISTDDNAMQPAFTQSIVL